MSVWLHVYFCNVQSLNRFDRTIARLYLKVCVDGALTLNWSVELESLVIVGSHSPRNMIAYSAVWSGSAVGCSFAGLPVGGTFSFLWRTFGRSGVCRRVGITHFYFPSQNLAISKLYDVASAIATPLYACTWCQRSWPHVLYGHFGFGMECGYLLCMCVVITLLC